MTRADPELDEPRIAGIKVDTRGGFATADDIARARRRICTHIASCYQGGGMARPVLPNAVSASLRLFPLGRPEEPEARLIRRTVPPMGNSSRRHGKPPGEGSRRAVRSSSCCGTPLLAAESSRPAGQPRRSLSQLGDAGSGAELRQAGEIADRVVEHPGRRLGEHQLGRVGHVGESDQVAQLM
jgi:hypothetical protein